MPVVRVERSGMPAVSSNRLTCVLGQEHDCTVGESRKTTAFDPFDGTGSVRAAATGVWETRTALLSSFTSARARPA